ncbi:histidinol-phosphate transaminase [Acidisoma cellulosilytica]|uniref:Histidinol-phosphate aminotransferase n=1 Tax=Acidisoma cellulosilyticum TaxID=2802395 RepID=A0A964E220_9PROT|nr:histidinol-phosphate transaminase [Acidisoma cellulosilyticum]MCB8879135.1 histidinol-phosphate transaminase [Acidisoma cellulosilyticum]
MTETRRPTPRPEILAIAPYVGGASTIPGLSRIIKLSSNEGAFGAPPAAQKAIADGAEKMARYPDGSVQGLREAIGAHFGLDPARIVCGNGSDEVLSMLIQAYGGPGTEILMSQYGFSIYEIFGTLAGSTVRKAPETDMTADIDALLAAVTEKTTLVFLANPNNPTGTLVPMEALQRLRDGLPPHVLLVIDAAYAEYVERPDYDGGLSLVEAGENTVMSRTFSKIWGLGGARLGWCYGPAAIIDVLNRLRPPFNINATAAAAGIAALSEPGWEKMSRDHNTVARARVAAALTQAGIRVWPSEGNFVLADFGTADQARAADAALKAEGIIARMLVSYGLAHCLRITIGTDEECQMVIDSLVAFMARANTPATTDA